MTSIEILDTKNQLVKRNADISSGAKSEVRELTAEENAEFEANELEIRNLDIEQDKLNRELEIKTNKKISIDRNMEKNDFIIRSLSEAYKAGQKDNIKLTRAFTVADEGADVVPVDLLNEVIMPLREEYLFGKLPVRVLNGLVGNPQIPVYSRGDKAGHVSENETAPQATGSFSNISFAPHRISAFCTISKQFLLQATPAAQDAIVRDLSMQIWDTIEETLLSTSAATEKAPAGLLNGKVATEISTYKDLVDFEAALREKKFKNVSFAISPRAEAWAKSTIKGTNATGMIEENGNVDGISTIVTSSIDPNQILLADWSNLIIGFWGDMTFQFYEGYSLAKDNLVGIVINGYWDAKLARPEALALAKVKVAGA